MKLKAKVAIITGASRGLGKAIAIGLAKEGAATIVAARTEKETKALPGTIHRTAEEIRNLGGRSLPVRCDITQEEDVKQMVHKTLEEFGQVDILVNNAGIAFPAPVWEMPLKRWELVLRVNLTGTFLCTKAVLPEMMERRRGCIINISSIQATYRAIRPARTGIAYGVSKAGIERFTWGVAAEVGKFNIAVNCVKPRGSVRTEGMEWLNPDADRSQWDSPERLVRAVVFLAGQDASGVTGLVATDEEICAWHGLL
ncbi:MAG: SDR family NAD(P)-dependent oxidoreductase [Thermodesulfobacteriota bacterium]